MNTNTSSLLIRATDALRDEMAANAADASIQLVGNVMTQLLRRKPEIAEKIVLESKGIKKAMEAMKKEARKHKSGNWACLDAITGMKIVLEHYEIEGISDMDLIYAISESMGAPTPQNNTSAIPEAPEPDGGDELDIDALLGGVG